MWNNPFVAIVSYFQYQILSVLELENWISLALDEALLQREFIHEIDSFAAAKMINARL